MLSADSDQFQFWVMGGQSQDPDANDILTIKKKLKVK